MYLFPLSHGFFFIIYDFGYFFELLFNLPYIKRGTGYWSFLKVSITNGQEMMSQTCFIILCHVPYSFEKEIND